MFYRIVNDLHTRTIVCCYRGRVGTDLSVCVWRVDLFFFLCGF
jgi:hypothetical protein